MTAVDELIDELLQAKAESAGLGVLFNPHRVALVLATPDGEIVRFSPGFAKALKRPPSDIYTANLFSYATENGRKTLRRTFDAALDDGHAVAFATFGRTGGARAYRTEANRVLAFGIAYVWVVLSEIARRAQ